MSRYAILIAGLDKDDLRVVEGKAEALHSAAKRDGGGALTWQVTPTALDAHALMAPITARSEQVGAQEEIKHLQQQLGAAQGDIHALEVALSKERAASGAAWREEIEALRTEYEHIRGERIRYFNMILGARQRHSVRAEDHERIVSDLKAQIEKERAHFSARETDLERERDEAEEHRKRADKLDGECGELVSQIERERRDFQERADHRDGIIADLKRLIDQLREQRKDLLREQDRVVADLKAQIDTERVGRATMETTMMEDLTHARNQLCMARAGKEPQAPGPCVQELRAEVLALQETLRHTTRALAALASDRRER